MVVLVTQCWYENNFRILQNRNMSSQTGSVAIISPSQDQTSLFSYRWVILVVFDLVSVINFMQILQFSIIANIVSKFYKVESYWVEMTTIVFFLSYVVFFYPIGFLVEKYNLKLTVVVASGLTLLGNVLKLLAANEDRFWIILVAQFVIAFGQVQLSSIPSKLATTWFGSDEVSTACAMAVLAMQLGSALGCVQSPFIVKSTDPDEMSKQFFDMFLIQAILSGCVFVSVLVLFRSRPKLPPSQSQLSLISGAVQNDVSFFDSMKKIAKNRNYWFVVLSLGLANGVWNSFGVLFNPIYLNYFPSGEKDAGIIGLLSVISGGCIGSMVFGIILDKTHRFKMVSFVILAASAITFALVGLTLEQKSRIASFVIIPLYGFFVASVQIVGYEYLVEITYPIPEACSSSTFNAAFFLISVVAALVFEALFKTAGYLWTFAVIFCILGVCAGFSLLIRSPLKRRDANLQPQNVPVNPASSIHSDANSTRVTTAKF